MNTVNQLRNGLGDFDHRKSGGVIGQTLGNADLGDHVSMRQAGKRSCKLSRDDQIED